jgi:hypothetical protein
MIDGDLVQVYFELDDGMRDSIGMKMEALGEDPERIPKVIEDLARVY